MSFVYPNFLWALSLLLIPIIIHLFHFRRYKKVLFPNVQFLKNVQKQTQSVKKVRNLLILIARLLALAFLVFAFAQPFIPLGTKAQQEDQIIGVYIDNSFSMENEGSQGPLFEQAKEKARKLVKAYPSSDQFLIHTNHSTSQHPINQDDAIAFIDAIDIQKTSKHLSEVLAIMERSLDGNGVAQKNMYVFSDLQKSDEIGLRQGIDSSSTLSIVPFLATENSNVSIDTAWFESPVIHLNKPIELNVRITNHGQLDIAGVPVSLEIDGVKKAVTSVNIDGNTSDNIRLGFTLSEGGWKKAKLTIEDAPIIFDDEYHLSFNMKPKINVFIANGKDYVTTLSTGRDHLSSVFIRDESFEVVRQNTGNIDLSALKLADLVILNEPSSVSNGLTAALVDYVSKGGSLLIIPSKSAQSNYLIGMTKALGILAYGNRVNQSIAVGKIDLNHPLFDQVFEGNKKKTPDNLSYPKVNQYIQMITSGKAAYHVVTLENQDAFLSSSKLGNGEIFQLAVPLNSEWSNFQEHWLFASLLPKMALNRSLDYPLSYTISNNNLFKAVPESRNLQGELSLKNNQTEWIPVVSNSSSSPYIDAGYDDLDAGHITLYNGDTSLQVVAFNYSREESINAYFSAKEIKEIMPNSIVNVVDNPVTYVKDTVTEMRFGKRFWKWCIILALIFLAIEILLLRFWPNKVN